MQEQKKVSVIVPVYNAEKHLAFCLDGILNQTYQNIELILVNDGSTDSTEKILAGYQQKYPDRIRVFTKPNSGVANTRNFGIEQADGYYIAFCDNDDFMEPELIENFVNADDAGYDILIGGYKRKTYEGKLLLTRNFSGKPAGKYVQMASWGKLYRTAFVKENGIRFLDCPIGEDVYMNILAYNSTQKIKVIRNDGYCWMYNEKSITYTDSNALNRTDDLIVMLEKIRAEVVPSDRQLMEYFYLRTVIYYILFSCKGVGKEKISAAYDKLFAWIQKNNIAKGNKYLHFFYDSGELISVKCAIAGFLLLKRLRLIKPALYLFSKL